MARPAIKKRRTLAALILFFAVSPSFAWQNAPNSCVLIFSADQSESKDNLLSAVSSGLKGVSEFNFLREQANKMGVRVWLFGGTAASFLHYVRWDLARKNGSLNLQADRFDYDFTNIFRSTQDLDIVVDGTDSQIRQFQELMVRQFPYFLGSKKNRWEVRSLRHRFGEPGQPGFKEALLNDGDFNNQNSDSNSLAMVEVTESSEPLVRDLRNWTNHQSVFLDDSLKGQISYFRSPTHFTTARAKLGENPEILSVVRLLVKAFQYELRISPASLVEMQKIINEFAPESLKNPTAIYKINEAAFKLIHHAVNIEYAVNTLDQIGLRKKLVKLSNVQQQNTTAWWLNREPLHSFALGQGSGRTAAQLSLATVAHETTGFLAYESITRAHGGEPNVLISRGDKIGETAAYGNGFYTRIGKEGARGTGFTIRFKVNPAAREKSDFEIHGDFVLVKNKRALEVIPESLNWTVEEYFAFLASGNHFDQSDTGIQEKLFRRIRKIALTRSQVDLAMKYLSSDEISQKAKSNIFNYIFSTPDAEKLISETDVEHIHKSLNGLPPAYDKFFVKMIAYKRFPPGKIHDLYKNFLNDIRSGRVVINRIKPFEMGVLTNWETAKYIKIEDLLLLSLVLDKEAISAMPFFDSLIQSTIKFRAKSMVRFLTEPHYFTDTGEHRISPWKAASILNTNKDFLKHLDSRELSVLSMMARGVDLPENLFEGAEFFSTVTSILLRNNDAEIEVKDQLFELMTASNAWSSDERNLLLILKSIVTRKDNWTDKIYTDLQPHAAKLTRPFRLQVFEKIVRPENAQWSAHIDLARSVFYQLGIFRDIMTDEDLNKIGFTTLERMKKLGTLPENLNPQRIYQVMFLNRLKEEKRRKQEAYEKHKHLGDRFSYHSSFSPGEMFFIFPETVKYLTIADALDMHRFDSFHNSEDHIFRWLFYSGEIPLSSTVYAEFAERFHGDFKTLWLEKVAESKNSFAEILNYAKWIGLKKFEHSDPNYGKFPMLTGLLAHLLSGQDKEFKKQLYESEFIPRLESKDLPFEDFVLLSIMLFKANSLGLFYDERVIPLLRDQKRRFRLSMPYRHIIDFDHVNLYDLAERLQKDLENRH